MKIRRIISILIVIGYMFLIFMLSNQAGSESSGLSDKLVKPLIKVFVQDYDSYSLSEQRSIYSSLSFMVRKTTHVMEYALLTVLVFLTLFKVKLLNRSIITFAIALVYSISDEIHQYFIPGRTGIYTDVLIDSVGILAALAVMIMITYFYQQRLTKKNAKES